MTLVLPGVRIVNESEAGAIKQFGDAGGRLVITGQSDEKLNGLTKAVRLPDEPARVYLATAQKDFSSVTPAPASPLLSALTEEGRNSIQVGGSTNLVAHAASIEAVPYIFMANFEGLKPGLNLTPATQRDVRIEVPSSFGTSMHLLPFLGV